MELIEIEIGARARALSSTSSDTQKDNYELLFTLCQLLDSKV
jgi:hypothetical protein